MMKCFYLPELNSFRTVDDGLDPLDAGIPADALEAPLEASFWPHKTNNKGVIKPDMEAIQARMWRQVKQIREERSQAGCDTAKGVMDTSEASLINLLGADRMAEKMGAAFTMSWTMADNSQIEHNAEDIQAAAMAVGVFRATVHGVSQMLRGQIEAAKNIEDILSIDIYNAPWPNGPAKSGSARNVGSSLQPAPARDGRQ